MSDTPAELSSGSWLPVPSTPKGIEANPRLMSDEDLAQFVSGVFVKFRAVIPYVIELRRRFAKLPRGKANIAGCATWMEFCERVLHRTDRAVRKAIALDEHRLALTQVPTLPTLPDMQSNRQMQLRAFKQQHPEYKGKSNREVDKAIQQTGWEFDPTRTGDTYHYLSSQEKWTPGSYVTKNRNNGMGIDRLRQRAGSLGIPCSIGTDDFGLDIAVRFRELTEAEAKSLLDCHLGKAIAIKFNRLSEANARALLERLAAVRRRPPRLKRKGSRK